MGKFKLNNNVEESVTTLANVEEMLKDTYDKVKKLHSGIDSMKWDGESKNHFYAMMGIILEYHKELDEVVGDIKKSMEELYDATERYDTYYAIQKLKEIK